MEEPMMKGKNKGITLIALVVTIIILIILATISVNILFDDNGMIGRVRGARQLQKLAEEKEQIEFAKVTVAIDNKGKIPMDQYIESLIQDNVTTKQNVKYNEDGTVQIATNMNRTLKIEADANGNVIAIAELGQENKVTTSIDKVQLTEKTSSIKVEIEVAKAENATYKYYYKEETGEYQQAYEGEDLTFTIERLKSGTGYWIKVEVANENGTVSKEVLGSTKEIIKGQEELGDVKVTEYNEKFENIKSGIILDSYFGEPATEEALIAEIKSAGIVTEENIMRNSNGNYEMITNEGYVYEVIFTSPTEISINYIGKLSP